MSNWLQQPYFTPGPQVFIKSTVSTFPSWFVTTVLSTDCYMQSLLNSSLSGVDYWLEPSYYNPLPKNEQGITDAYIQTAEDRINRYPQSGNDPVSLGTEYGNLLISILKSINSGGMTGGVEGKSLWDMWVKM